MLASPDGQEAGGEAFAGASDAIQFVDEPIAVEYDSARFGPRSLTWRSREFHVEEILLSWQDFHTPAYAGHARGWLHRRHRNYYIVRVTGGDVLEVYLDRAGGQRTWVLLKRHRLSLQMLTVGEWGANCYLLEGNGQCLVVDPGDEPERILAALAGRPVVAIVLTHGHRDHLGAVAAIRQVTGAPLWLHPADTAAFGVQADRELAHGESVRVGWFGVRIEHMPGHTPGSVCLRFDERALVGDTLFPGGPGRTDSPQALDDLVASLRNVVFAWPDETRFFPGHGEGSTIGVVRPAFRAFEVRARPAGLCGDVEWAGPEQPG
jgi:hydroxyacylglutathione hydrolase